MKQPSAGKTVLTFLGYALGSTVWSLLTWGLTLSLHGRVEYFLEGPAQALILGAAFAPLILAMVVFLRSGPLGHKLALALGIAIPPLFTLAFVLAALFA